MPTQLAFPSPSPSNLSLTSTNNRPQTNALEIFLDSNAEPAKEVLIRMQHFLMSVNFFPLLQMERLESLLVREHRILEGAETFLRMELSVRYTQTGFFWLPCCRI
jgi:hypothetical protein